MRLIGKVFPLLTYSTNKKIAEINETAFYTLGSLDFSIIYKKYVIRMNSYRGFDLMVHAMV